MHRAPRLYDLAAAVDLIRSIIHRNADERSTTPARPELPALPAREITCARNDAANECCLRIAGILDTHTAPEIRSVFDAVVSERRPSVIVDLENLTMIDSSGIGTIVSLFKRVNAYGGFVAVNGMRKQPLAVCKLLKLDRVLAPLSR